MNRSFYLVMLLLIKLIHSMLANVVILTNQQELDENILLQNSDGKFNDVTLNSNKPDNQNQLRLRIKKNRKKFEKFLRKTRSLENESFYQNFFNTKNVRRNEPVQYCGEALYYLVEYYCVYIKKTSVYIPETDLDLVSVISRREISKGKHFNFNFKIKLKKKQFSENIMEDTLGIVNECCYSECKPDNLDKYCY